MANSVIVSGTLGSATSSPEFWVTQALVTLDVGAGANTLVIELWDGASWLVAETTDEDAVKVIDLPEGAGPGRWRVRCSVYAEGTARYSVSGR